MSTPQNILGSFRSYAYHHILMVCNSTAAAEALSESTEITKFQHPVNKLRYAPRSIDGNEDNQYITLIDGTSDARFYIVGAEWENVLAMDNVSGDLGIPQSSSMSLDGELEIIEPLGANFLEVLTNTCDALDTDPVGLVFVLKTIFVGHNTDGTSEMITTIKPLQFVNYDITALFDSSGSRYKMMFVGIVNGVAKLPQTQQMFSGLSFSVKENDSLAATLKSLAVKVNESYKGYLARAKADFAKTLYDESKRSGTPLSAKESAKKASKFFDDNYRKVQYEIIASDYTDATKYTAADNESVRIANKRADASFNFGQGLGVESVIKKIMASSTGVINDGKGLDDGKRYIYKISSGLNSSVDGFVVEYHVRRYEMLMLPFESSLNGIEYEPEDGQSIEFDYIFTGKNVDIQSFDIKMEMGMAFFQIAGTTDSLSTSESTRNGHPSNMVYTTGSQQVASKGKKQRSKTPLFLGSKIIQPISRNSRNPVDSASFQALLNRHAALENVEAKMVIYGNPQLLDEMQISTTDLRKPPPKSKAGKTINPRWLSTPTLVKVNVKMPVDANDVNTEYNDFWYTGYYNLFAVKQIFSDGVFTQELDMMSLPVADKLQKRVDKPSTVNVSKEETKKVYDEIFAEFNVPLDKNPIETQTALDRRREANEKTP